MCSVSRSVDSRKSATLTFAFGATEQNSRLRFVVKLDVRSTVGLLPQATIAFFGRAIGVQRTARTRSVGDTARADPPAEGRPAGGGPHPPVGLPPRGGSGLQEVAAPRRQPSRADRPPGLPIPALE